MSRGEYPGRKVLRSCPSSSLFSSRISSYLERLSPCLDSQCPLPLSPAYHHCPDSVLFGLSEMKEG